METSDFPGYNRCATCKSIISTKEIHNHILNCRSKISNENKICTFCNKQIPINNFEEHIQNCNEQNNSSSNYPEENFNLNHSKNDNDENDNINFQTPRAQTPIQDGEISSKQIIKSENKKNKLCIICFKQIDEEDYGYHVASCSNNNQNEQSSTISKTKFCPLCSKEINQLEYEKHLQSCSNDEIYSSEQIFERTDNINQINKEKKKENKFCILCCQSFDQSEYENHILSCSPQQLNSNNKSKQKNSKKECIICFQSVDQSDYIEHVTCCSSEQDSKIYSNNNKKYKQTNNLKECVICSNLIDENEYINHVQLCSSDNSPTIIKNGSSSNYFSQDDKRFNGASASAIPKNNRDCIICFKSIDLSEYENHVLACVTQTENQEINSKHKINLKCLSCNRLINKEENMFHEIECNYNHIHCLTCLRQSMDEFARNREIPVCHKRLCDYELSRHDISLIPLERRLSDRLLKLVKGEKRPLCTKCYFYININENENFDDHIELCTDLIPCEYCQLPYSFNQLENHTKQCRSDQISLNEKLINFILPKTKYPFTKQQITIFIQQHKKNPRNHLDPHSIINALAVYGRTFPYEIPTRECGICMESRPYDDIYVFDCEESHKICYECYYQSCETKMNSGEILTCALCTHPLKDGELNQLRISLKDLQKIRDYQMKKTFELYSNRTKGIIKCPNQNCSWVAEAEDPNERFKVTCPQCQREFCSLCNQQYHYRTSCQQLPQITQRWFFWCQNERQRYLRMRAQQDNEFAKQLEDYNKQTKENNDRNNDLRRRYDELMNDEQYKAQNCRLCPSCKRVVQRLEGCDSMVCGQDAHGGNLQSGCGTKFNWQQAQPYAATATQQPKQVILDLPKPDNPVVHHDGVKCDLCQSDINGIRFDCVHCPSLTFCEKCEQQATLNHSQENQAFEQQQHVFKLIMVPEEEAIRF